LNFPGQLRLGSPAQSGAAGDVWSPSSGLIGTESENRCSMSTKCSVLIDASRCRSRIFIATMSGSLVNQPLCAVGKHISRVSVFLHRSALSQLQQTAVEPNTWMSSLNGFTSWFPAFRISRPSAPLQRKRFDHPRLMLMETTTATRHQKLLRRLDHSRKFPGLPRRWAIT